MATYKAIKGLEIQIQSSDPSDPPKGQVWYNTTAGALKVAGAGAWATGTTLPTPGSRYNVPGFGILTAGAIVGGYGGTPTDVSETTEYDGTSWSVGGAMVTQAYSSGSAGPLTGAFTAGGENPGGTVATSATYDGTSWTAVGSLVDGATVKAANQSAGNATAGLVFGGFPANTTSEEFDGASWSAGNDLNTARTHAAGGGTQTDAFAAGGGYTPVVNTTENYNGTSWTAGNPANTARRGNMGSAGTSSASSGFFAGGIEAPPSVNFSTKSEEFDGTSWAAMPTIATARANGGAFGTKTAGVLAAGSPGPTETSAVEEFIVPGITTITTST